MLAGRFGVLACASSTHMTVPLEFTAPAVLLPFRLTQMKTGRLWSRILIHPSSLLTCLCPLLDGGQILCRKKGGLSMEIGGCCACMEFIAAVLDLDTIENRIWAVKQSGPWRQSALLSIVSSGPSDAQGIARPSELWDFAAMASCDEWSICHACIYPNAPFFPVIRPRVDRTLALVGNIPYNVELGKTEMQLPTTRCVSHPLCGRCRDAQDREDLRYLDRHTYDSSRSDSS